MTPTTDEKIDPDLPPAEPSPAMAALEHLGAWVGAVMADHRVDAADAAAAMTAFKKLGTVVRKVEADRA